MNSFKNVFTSITDNIVGSSIATKEDANKFIKSATNNKFQSLDEVNKFINNVSAIPGEVNEFLGDLDNFLIKQHINQVIDIEIVSKELFYKGEIPVADGEQVLTNRLFGVTTIPPYDPDAYTPAQYTALKNNEKTPQSPKLKEDTTRQYQLVDFKTMIGNSIYGEVVKAAFTSLPNFQGFLANYSRKLLQSVYYLLYTYQIKVLNTKIVNTIKMTDAFLMGPNWKFTGKASDYQDIATMMAKIANHMEQPTNWFNVGYQTTWNANPIPSTKAVYGNIKTRKDLILMANPTISAELENRVYSTLFHQDQVNLDKYKKMAKLLINETQPAYPEWTLTDGSKKFVTTDSELQKAVPGKPNTIYMLDARTAMRWLDRIDTKTSGTWLTGQITVFHIMFLVFYAVKNGIGVALDYTGKTS